MRSVEPIGSLTQQLDVSTNCEFCTEILSPQKSRFVAIYSPGIAHRCVDDKQEFVIWPTLGQLFLGSLLLIPKKHYESFSDLDDSSLHSAMEHIDEICGKLKCLGTPIIFEHGARCSSGGGCGIYHAHVHILPAPSSLLCRDVLPESDIKYLSSLREGWLHAHDQSEYLLFQDTSNSIGYVDENTIKKFTIRSQHMRRMIVDHFHLNRSWDWRTYIAPEQDVFASLAFFQK